ncbi:metal ABC transporter substrate-binding protein [Kineococcus indalonis]|uniref:metal ABC transporter substrate-binding protein n=1 Tax=Kineococcus indalonis TaxID=2696566 RepID=UPI001412CC42|nr:metal ABC transporter substrate-binding protein [Kineococcus indalonis]NAZ87639.1 zinc ABC transporter solute-binding protein [Kineococcus indalonis]
MHAPSRLLTAATALLATAACASTGAAGDGGAGGAGGGLRVTASSYPLHYVAERVTAGRGAVDNLVPPGADSHDLELSAQQVGELGEADLVVHLSGLQPAVDEALEVQAPAHLVDAAPLADLHGDPHFWLDPTRVARLAEQVAEAASEVDAAGAQQYAANAEQLGQELAELDREYATALAPCAGAGATLVTAHEAFGYLAQRYGLQQLGIKGIDPHVDPSPARLREVVDTVRGRDVRTVFFEAATSPAVAETLAQDTGVQTSVLHPLERVTQEQDYPGLMRENLAALTGGLNCGA